MTPLQFTKSVRSLKRIRQIAQVLSQQGFGYLVAQLNLARYLPVWMLRRRRSRAAAEPKTIGKRMADICSTLGPTFVKFGQLLTTRPDLLPAEILDELSKLQDRVPPFDGSDAMRMIEEELKRPIGECFATIESTPVASGSIGQVHLARTLEGVDVVVKVQRPGIKETIATDMDLLRWLADSLERFVPELAPYRPRMLASELEQLLTRELDFVNEASAAQRLGDAFAETEGIHIPKVYWNLSSSRILTLKVVPGRNLNTILAEAESGVSDLNRRTTGRRLVDCFLKQVFEVGLFHADPHPGNIFIDPPSQVALLDFGQVGTITDDLMTQIVVMVYAAVNREIDVIVDALADLDALGESTDRRQLSRALLTLLDKYHGQPIKRINLGALLNEFTDIVRQHDVIIPRDVLMLIKSTALVSSVTQRLDPELDVLEPLGQRLREVIRQRLSPSRISRDSKVWGWHLFNLTRAAPRQLREVLRKMAAGGWRLRLRHENIDRLTDELDRSSNRLAFSVVIAAIIVGSSIVVSANTSLTVFNIKFQYFGIAGYLFAGLLGLGLSWAIFRSGRLH
ncbi:MAG: phosphotransferase [Phycisphaerae bacterium]|nr:phosphotransferase [Phycisphaerae bacterium]